MNDPSPTIAYELFYPEHERIVREYLDDIGADYYVVKQEGVTTYGVVVVHTSDVLKVLETFVPRG